MKRWTDTWWITLSVIPYHHFVLVLLSDQGHMFLFHRYCFALFTSFCFLEDEGVVVRNGSCGKGEGGLVWRLHEKSGY